MQARQSELGDGTYIPSLNPEFGDARGFWNRYEELAENTDRNLSKDLNSNLDTLLIFAGLFSAINTAFISLTMSDLSPDPQDKTNSLLEVLILRIDNRTIPSVPLSPFYNWAPDPASVTANCLLYASLCCSLLAAAGAMFGKEWLQFFDRKGNVSSLGDQARLRQKKITAVEEWYLRETIQLLPYTLLLSLGLFFAGLVPYLLRVHTAVANVVIAFTVVGVILWLVTIWTCIQDQHSPYQTSFTYFAFRQFNRGDHSEFESGSGAGSRRSHNLSVYPFVARRPFRGLSGLVRQLWTAESNVIETLAGGLVSGNRGHPPQPLRSASGPQNEGGVQSSQVPAPNPAPSNSEPCNSTGGTPTESGPRPNPEPATAETRNGSNPAGAARDPETAPGTPINKTPEVESNDYHILNAGTARWLLEITSKPEDVLIIAHNLCCLELDSEARKVIRGHKASWKRLLYFALDSLQHLQDHPGAETKRRAEFMGAALCHLLIDQPRNQQNWQDILDQFQEKLSILSSSGSSDPHLQIGVLKYVLINDSRADVWRADVEVAEYDLRKAFLHAQVLERSLKWSVVVGAIRVQYDDNILNLMAVLISTNFGPHGYGQNSDDTKLRESAVMAYSGKSLVKDISCALSSHGKAFESTEDAKDLDALYEIYAALLYKVQDLYPPREANGGSQPIDAGSPPVDAKSQSIGTMRDLLCGFVRKLITQPLYTPALQHSLVTAVLTLRGFTPDVEICQTINNAIICISSHCGQEIDESELHQFILAMIKFIAHGLGEIKPPISKLGDEDHLIHHIISAALGPDKTDWLPFLANKLEVWFPETEDAQAELISGGFAQKMLKDFTRNETENQDNLVKIIVHIPSIKTEEWCKQLIDSQLINVVAQSILGEEGEAGNDKPVPVVAALRLLLAVFVKSTSTDWAKDQMHDAIRKLSKDVSDPKSKILGKLSDKDTGVDIVILVEFIEHIRDRRTFDKEDLSVIKNAIELLKQSSNTSGETSESHDPETATSETRVPLHEIVDTRPKSSTS